MHENNLIRFKKQVNKQNTKSVDDVSNFHDDDEQTHSETYLL